MSRRKRKTKGNWRDFILFLLIILCVYFILSLFDSSLAGDNGRNLGKSIRALFGGAFIVLLLFWLYLCVASFMKFRVPLLPRQVLGTLQLYVSFAFMLGLLKETGFDSEATLFIPGAIGHGLAKFFVLNIGTFITLLLVVGSFILSAYLYGSKILKVSLPPLPSFNLANIADTIRKYKRSRKIRKKHDKTKEVFAENETPNDDFYFDSTKIAKFRNARIESEAEPEPELMPETEPESKPQNTVEVFDNLLAILDNAPVLEKKKEKASLPARKIRRPLRFS